MPRRRLWYEKWSILATITATACLMLVSGCTPSVFPYKAMDGVYPDFDFSRWQMFPDQSPQQKVQLGGRILHADATGETLKIITAQLPIPQDPSSGPEEGKSGGEFVILYHAMVDPLFLHRGNRLMVVGQTSPPTQVDVDHTIRQLPTLTALCIHFWHAGEEDILVQGSAGAGSQRVKELTYCKTAL